MSDDDKVDNVEQADRGTHELKEVILDGIDNDDDDSPEKKRPNLEQIVNK